MADHHGRPRSATGPRSPATLQAPRRRAEAAFAPTTVPPASSVGRIAAAPSPGLRRWWHVWRGAKTHARLPMAAIGRALLKAANEIARHPQPRPKTSACCGRLSKPRENGAGIS